MILFAISLSNSEEFTDSESSTDYSSPLKLELEIERTANRNDKHWNLQIRQSEEVETDEATKICGRNDISENGQHRSRHDRV